MISSRYWACVILQYSSVNMSEPRNSGFLEDLLYFNSLVLWDCVPEDTCYQLYEGGWETYKSFSTPNFTVEKNQLDEQIQKILSRSSVLDIVIPVMETISSQSAVDKPLAKLKGHIEPIDGLKMQFDEKKNVTEIYLIVPPGVTDGKAFSAALNRKKDALQRYRKHQFQLYYRYDMRLRVLNLARICKETLPEFPEFRTVARFDRRVSDEGGRPRNWYEEVTRIGLAMNYLSSNRQGKSIGDLQDFIAENNRQPVPRNAVGEELNRTCRKWGVSLLTGMGIDSYKSAVGSVWTTMKGSQDPQIRRAVEHFTTEQKIARLRKN